MRAPLSQFIPILLAFLFSANAVAEPLLRENIAALVPQPYSLGDPIGDDGVYELIDISRADAGFVFETEPLAPLPGFSGAPVNLLVLLDHDGKFLDVRLIEQNEPIFVSGLGEAPFRAFLEQYAGHSITSSLVVGSPFGCGSGGSSLVYLDGVTKATASVRIAHESIMGAALAVAREKMQGISTVPPAYPDPAYSEPLDWEALIRDGLATRLLVTNAEIDAAFAGTIWESDDPEATDNPDDPYLNPLIIDIGPLSIARAVLDDSGLDELQGFLEISGDDEPILLIETARHGLVGPEIVRNTAPDWISAEQSGFSVALRDADLFFDLANGVPDGRAVL
ncbi:hypothetical protein [Sedimentitalea todarodis]|uniref:hypothetical protein n=1 Tax=Sedimentitalea todarodis TaxID=1631240 RepID=UPI00292E3D3E|nr:hypothetical protein [Sedimentitalea todarodis]